jgi:integrase
MSVSSVNSATTLYCAPTSSPTPNVTTPWSAVSLVLRFCPRINAMAKKGRSKANGEGTIYKRGKGYCGQYHVIARDGTKKRRSVYGKTRAEAAEKLAAAIVDRDRGLSFDAGTLTVGEHLDGYLEDAKGRLRPKPFNRAEGLVRNHVKPALGNVRLKDLAPAHLRGLYSAKLDSGLSGRTVGYIHVTFYGALKQAVADGLLARNPAEGVKPPRTDKSEMAPSPPPRQRRCWTRPASRTIGGAPSTSSP